MVCQDRNKLSLRWNEDGENPTHELQGLRGKSRDLTEAKTTT